MKFGQDIIKIFWYIVYIWHYSMVNPIFSRIPLSNVHCYNTLPHHDKYIGLVYFRVHFCPKKESLFRGKVLVFGITVWHQRPTFFNVSTSSILSSNSKANGLELLESIKEMFLLYYTHDVFCRFNFSATDYRVILGYVMQVT